MNQRLWVGLFAGATIFVLLFPLTVMAQDPPKFAAILRDENALALTPTTRSWGMGGTYVGVDRYWSNNPASIAGTESMTAALGYSYWNHDTGPKTDAGRMDLWAPVPLGDLDLTLRLMGYYYKTRDSEDAAPPLFDLEYESSTIGLQAGLDLTDWWAVGFGGYPYEKGTVKFNLPGEGGVSAVNSTALSQLGSVQLGTLFRLPEHVNIGAQYIYIIDELKDSYSSPPDYPPSGKDNYRIWYLAVGASWEPVEWLLLGVDYWDGKSEGDSAIAGSDWDADIDRWNFGAEVRPCKYFSVRAGSDNESFTAGATVSPIPNLDINYAYVDKAFGDKEDVWGETSLHTVSATIRF